MTLCLVHAQRQLQQELGREPTAGELARKMEMSVTRVRKILGVAQEPVSLETPLGEELESRLGDLLVDQGGVSPAQSVSADIKHPQHCRFCR
jgi:RNA polymerase primary sigma factor